MANKRKRGDKYPKHETKTAIIQYIAESENGERTRVEIIEHLKEKYNIRESKNIDMHLKKLCHWGYLEKIETKKGLSISYGMLGGYYGLKFCFRFMNSNNKAMDFLKSKYVQGTINNHIFSDLSEELHEVLTHPMIQMVVLSDAKMRKDPTFNDIFNGVSEGEKDELIEFSKMPVMRKLITSIINDVDEKMKTPSGTLQDLPKRMDLIKDKVWGFISSYLDSSLLSKEAIRLFPESERKSIIQMLKVSPSCLDFITRLDEMNFRQALRIFKAYLFPNILLMHEMREFLDQEKKSGKSSEDSVDRFLSGYAKDPSVSTPILIILKSLLIHDVFFDAVLWNDWVGEYYAALLIPEKTRKRIEMQEKPKQKHNSPEGA